jgi:uncharacterized protein (TIGR00297 family)
VIERAFIGFVLACAIALAAWRAGSLSRSGTAAAIAVGTVCIAAGWAWGILLIAFFVASSALSRAGEGTKTLRTEAVVAKGGARDAWQVLANGGVFALAAALSIVAPWSGWPALGAGSLAAATADTWGTEIGTLTAAPPRLITTWRTVPVGTSGGITPAGLLATLAGALFIGALVWLLRWPPRAAIAAAAGGIAGALADSIIGAHWQTRRWCTGCQAHTERMVHSCGSRTERSGGARWLDNDAVNFLSAAVGALAAVLVAW